MRRPSKGLRLQTRRLLNRAKNAGAAELRKAERGTRMTDGGSGIQRRFDYSTYYSHGDGGRGYSTDYARLNSTHEAVMIGGFDGEERIALIAGRKLPDRIQGYEGDVGVSKEVRNGDNVLKFAVLRGFLYIDEAERCAKDARIRIEGRADLSNLASGRIVASSGEGHVFDTLLMRKGYELDGDEGALFNAVYTMIERGERVRSEALDNHNEQVDRRNRSTFDVLW